MGNNFAVQKWIDIDMTTYYITYKSLVQPTCLIFLRIEGGGLMRERGFSTVGGSRVFFGQIFKNCATYHR